MLASFWMRASTIFGALQARKLLMIVLQMRCLCSKHPYVTSYGVCIFGSLKKGFWLRSKEVCISCIFCFLCAQFSSFFADIQSPCIYWNENQRFSALKSLICSLLVLSSWFAHRHFSKKDEIITILYRIQLKGYMWNGWGSFGLCGDGARRSFFVAKWNGCYYLKKIWQNE